ncbi:PAS domain S-box protein [Bradyrhizobium sp. WD16]|uniref:PAS domain S-box protein n=1 Tax=Bradyrhizobium sp. WD16 TaxID=1521768 RepID=UPI0020A304B2|nr:PAS domain S-box protein [Bradyrhizobium sp. WD16]UTD28121.1 hypothetical protein DB459_15675 [Bradyrhizobium sp. WD16]
MTPPANKQIAAVFAGHGLALLLCLVLIALWAHALTAAPQFSSSSERGVLVVAIVLVILTLTATSYLTTRSALQYRRLIRLEDGLQEREAHLLESSRYTRSLIEASLDPLVTINPDGKITDVNEATIRATGIARETLVGSDFSNYFTEPETARSGYREVFATGFVTDYPLVLRHVSGALTDVLYNASLYRDANGNVAGVFAAARDITERKRIEERNSQLAAIVESSDDAIFSKTLEGIITSWNRGAELIYGYTSQEVSGRSVAILMPPEHRQEMLSNLALIREGRHIVHFETPRRRKDGTDIYVSLTMSPVKDAAGRVIGASAIERDVTELKRTELRVAQLAAQNRLLLDSVGEGVCGMDTDGRCTFVNPAASQLLGFAIEELVGHNGHRKFHHIRPDGQPYREDECPFNAAFREGVVTRGRDRFWRKDGSSFPVEFVSAPTLDAGKITGAVVTFRDITELKRAEEELRDEHDHLEELVALRTADLTKANERLAATNRELETFSYTISHDLRVPIRAIDGFSRILLQEYSSKLDAEGRRVLNVVRDSTTKIAELIDDILAFSAIGRNELIAAPIDMDGLVHQLLGEFEPAVSGRKLTFDIKPLAPAQGDPTMIRRVWTNLIDNAVKFTAPKPDAVIEIGSTAGEKETVYYVKDNGVGFDMQYVRKLFDPFMRLHGTEFSGTGIGLAIVRRIVARHGGRVRAEGKVNEGATVYFSLPSRESPQI